MNINMLEVAKTGAPVIGVAALAVAVAEAPILLALVVCTVTVCVGGGLVIAGLWAAQGFPRFGASA